MMPHTTRTVSTVGDIIREAKALSRMSWDEIERSSGYSAVNLKRWQRGERERAFTTLFDVLEAQGCVLMVARPEEG